MIHNEIYFITAQKILVMFIFIAVGFVMRRTRLLSEQSGKVLSVLETSMFLPAFIFNNLSTNLTANTISGHMTSFLVGVGFLVAAVIVAKVFSLLFGKTKPDRKLYTYIFAFSNYAYFGYPIIESVFGKDMLSNTIVFAVPFTITIFTYGVYLLTCEEKTEKLQIGKIIGLLLKPVLIAVVLGVICGLLSVKVPMVISDTLSMASSCMSPISMILTGYVLAAFPFVELFKSSKAYIISVIRLIIIPVLFASILWAMGLRGEYYIIPVIISAMPVGMNVIVFAEATSEDSKYSARICFVSYIVSLITIPQVFSALSYLASL